MYFCSIENFLILFCCAKFINFFVCLNLSVITLCFLWNLPFFWQRDWRLFTLFFGEISRFCVLAFLIKIFWKWFFYYDLWVFSLNLFGFLLIFVLMIYKCIDTAQINLLFWLLCFLIEIISGNSMISIWKVGGLKELFFEEKLIGLVVFSLKFL